MAEVVRNSFGDDRIPTFFVNGDSLFELGEEEIAFVEVAEEVFSYSILLFEGGSAVVVVGELEVAGVDLEVGAGFEQVVVFAEDLSFWQLFYHEWVDLHCSRN